MRTPEGVVKVLDFGLAKAVEPAAVSVGPDSPALTLRATEAGLILGTAGYMPPKQAAGKPVDKRADVWAFGVVLFELLTGTRLFNGETVSHTLADVLRAPLDFDRLRDIGEARVVLQEYTGVEEAAAPTPVGRKTAWVVGAAVLALIAVVAGLGWWKATRPVDRPLARLDVDLGAEYSNGDVIISPDGGRLVFVSKGRLFTRWLHQEKTIELARNGRELFYRTMEQQIMVVSYTAKGDSFMPNKPRL